MIWWGLPVWVRRMREKKLGVGWLSQTCKAGSLRKGGAASAGTMGAFSRFGDCGVGSFCRTSSGAVRPVREYSQYQDQFGNRDHHNSESNLGVSAPLVGRNGDFSRSEGTISAIRNGQHQSQDEPKWTDKAQALAAVAVASLIIALIFINVVLTRHISRSAAVAVVAAKTAERALTELERPFVIAKVTNPGFSVAPSSHRRGHDLVRDRFEISVINLGRTPANLTRLEYPIWVGRCMVVRAAS